MRDNNVAAVRDAYAVAERKDLEGWITLFTPEGIFTDNSVGLSYRGHALADPVRNYGTAFSNIGRRRFISAAAIDAFIVASTTTDPPEEVRGRIPRRRVVQMRLGLKTPILSRSRGQLPDH